MPALFTSASSEPNFATTSSTIAALRAASRTSPCRAKPSGRSVDVLYVNATFQPSRASRSTTARPMPRAPPVMSAVGKLALFLVLVLERRDHRRIGQRCHVAHGAAFGDVAKKTAHDLAAARFREVGSDQDFFRTRDRADLRR